MLTHSDNIGNIAKAMAAAQSEVKNVVKDSDNPFFKSRYANLATILNTVRPIYSKHGVAITQIPQGLDAENRITVETLFLHESGEWILGSTTVPLAPGKVDPQVIGSGTTYACRYAMAAMGLVAAQDESDDDGEAASGRPSTAQGTQNTVPAPPVADKPKKVAKAPADLKNTWTPEETDEFNGLMTEIKGYMHSMNLFDEYEDLLTSATKAMGEYGPAKILPHTKAKRDQAKKDMEEFVSR